MQYTWYFSVEGPYEASLRNTHDGAALLRGQKNKKKKSISLRIDLVEDSQGRIFAVQYTVNLDAWSANLQTREATHRARYTKSLSLHGPKLQKFFLWQ